MAGVAHSITSHKQTKKPSLLFSFVFMWSLLPRSLTNQNLFIFTAAGFCAV